MIKVLKFILTIFILYCFNISCTPISKIFPNQTTPVEIYKHPDFDKHRMATHTILPFNDAIDYPNSGKKVSLLFGKILRSTGKFNLTNRADLEKILQDKNLKVSKSLSEAILIGRLIKAEVIVMGSVTTWDKGFWPHGWTIVGASIKAVHIETGKTLWALDKSTQASYENDGLNYGVPCEVVAERLCQDMVKALVKL